MDELMCVGEKTEQVQEDSKSGGGAAGGSRLIHRSYLLMPMFALVISGSIAGAWPASSVSFWAWPTYKLPRMQILTDTHTAIYSRFSKRVEKNKKIMPEREKRNGLHWAIGWRWRERERWIPNGPIRAHPFISSKYAKPSEKKNDVTPSFSLSLNRVPFLILFLFPLSCVLFLVKLNDPCCDYCLLSSSV